ncbi:hypothetical protein LLE89_12290, partial [Staphylococcus epidermidis]|uniref:hypothetical protein n=1 Tax=Staphylococcus epidermidis TaxID=1282 RepID=UPI001E5C9852
FSFYITISISLCGKIYPRSGVLVRYRVKKNFDVPRRRREIYKGAYIMGERYRVTTKTANAVDTRL